MSNVKGGTQQQLAEDVQHGDMTATKSLTAVGQNNNEQERHSVSKMLCPTRPQYGVGDDDNEFGEPVSCTIS